jgi:hypothetical protein
VELEGASTHRFLHKCSDPRLLGGGQVRQCVGERPHLAGGNPFDNRNTIYGGFPDDAALDRDVHRVAADSVAVAYLARNYTPTGHIAIPVLALHTTGDQVVPSWAENDYDAITAAAGTSRLFVVQYVVAPNHCQFTDAQIGTAFDELRTWVRGGQRPAGGMLSARETR